MSSISSCIECPNFVNSTTLDGATTVGGCKEIGTVVFIGGGTSSLSHLQSLAAKCPSAGIETENATPEFMPFAQPSGVIPKIGAADVLSKCNSCVHYRRNDSTLNQPACAAKGALVDPESSHVGCHFADKGIPDIGASMAMLHVIVDPSKIADSPKAAAKIAAKVESTIEQVVTFNPAEYVTDRKVDDDDKGIIRAWRLISVGDKGKEIGVYLPIFEPEYFTEAEREKIPTFDDDSHPELYFDGNHLEENFAIISWLTNQTLCMIGEPGVGKTEGWAHLAYLTQAPFTHIQLSEGSLEDDIIGKVGFDPAIGTHFVWGELPRAWVRPGFVLSDEINTPGDNIRQLYRAATGGSKKLFLYGEENMANRVAVKHDHCFHGVALNPAYDPRNLGTQEMADADVRRLCMVYMETPDDATIKAIILAKVAANEGSLTDEELNGIMRVREDIREMSRSGALPYSWSIAQDVKVATLMRYYSPANAYKRALLDYVHPDAAEAVMKAVQSTFGFATN